MLSPFLPIHWPTCCRYWRAIWPPTQPAADAKLATVVDCQSRMEMLDFDSAAAESRAGLLSSATQRSARHPWNLTRDMETIGRAEQYSRSPSAVCSPRARG